MKLWYAVMRDMQDDDWGYGSYDLEEARKKARLFRDGGEPEAYIAVIDENDGCGAVCIDEIHDI